MANYYIDGITSTASVAGEPRFLAPLPLSTTPTAFEQDWVAVESGYTPSSMGTAHPTLTSYYLCSESARTPIGAGVVRFTRTYAAKPADYSSYESYAMSHIQYQTSGGLIRLSANFVTSSTIEHKFYRIAASGGDYTTPLGIPLVEKWFPTRIISGVTSYFTIANDDTTPTGDDYVTDYIDTITICAEASSVSQWMGPIYERKTRYVIAK